MAIHHESEIHAIKLTVDEKEILPLMWEDFLFIGATGFEPATSTSRTWRSTKLSHAPL